MLKGVEDLFWKPKKTLITPEGDLVVPELGEEQKKAFDSIIQFFEHSENIAYSLTGSAGTGKSFMTSYIIDWIEDHGYDYTLCAPTHKAALVMKQYTKRNTNTLHRLLALSPNIAILDLDLRELQFVTSKVTDNIPYHGIVICDEASMINDDLFDLLLEKVSDRGSQILFCSDSKQLLPVKQQHCSKVYDLPDSFELTKIYRQSHESALMPILQELREHEIHNLVSSEGAEGSLIVEPDMKKFLEMAVSEVKTAVKTKNVLHTKITAYTNKRVELYNQAVRKFIWPSEGEYHVGEILTAYENGECDGMEYWNSMDYIIVEKPRPTVRDLPHFYPIQGWELTLWDPYDEDTFTIFILSRENKVRDFEALSGTIERIRLQAIDAKKRKMHNSYKYWRNYYELINSFATPVDLFYDGRLIRKKSFDYGYACTTHKLQGSSLDNIFVDMKNIKKCSDDLVRRQLQYVALSRTRKDAYVLQ